MERLAALFPNGFTIVMASGSISIDALRLGHAWVGGALFTVAIAAWLLACTAGVARGRRDGRALGNALTHHESGPGFLTLVAATAILGSLFAAFHVAAWLVTPLFGRRDELAFEALRWPGWGRWSSGRAGGCWYTLPTWTTPSRRPSSSCCGGRPHPGLVRRHWCVASRRGRSSGRPGPVRRLPPRQARDRSARCRVGGVASRRRSRPGDRSGPSDEEIQPAPEKYRAPIILCYLEGRTQRRGRPAARLAGRHRQGAARPSVHSWNLG